MFKINYLLQIIIAALSFGSFIFNVHAQATINPNGSPTWKPAPAEEVIYIPGDTTYNGGVIGLPPVTSTNPSQQKPASTGAANAVADATKCTLGQVAGNVGRNLFESVVGNTTISVLNPTVVPVLDVKNASKEVGTGPMPGWDSIAYCIVNSVIQYLSDATIDWINNGFDGNPVFVDDPGQIVRDIGKDTINSFIDSIGDGILCERFSADITFAIVRNYKDTRKVVPDRCTLEEASANIDRFLSGEDFSFEMMDVITSNPNNNVVGAYAISQSKLGKVITERVDALFAELSWGDGFLSWKDEKTGKTITPGSYIGLNSGKMLGLSMDRLVLADEFDEIVTALVNQLIKTALNEVLGDGKTKSWTGKTSI